MHWLADRLFSVALLLHLWSHVRRSHAEFHRQRHARRDVRADVVRGHLND